MQLRFQYVLVDHQRIVISKRVDPCDHLVDEHAEGPPIHWFPMPFFLQNLRSQVLWRAAECKSPALDSFGKAEVSEFEISIAANQYVLWFEIAVDDIFAVQMLEDEQHLRCVETK